MKFEAPLNWREVARLADLVRPELQGLFVDRLIVPERPRFPGGYIKNEWALRLGGHRSEAAFHFGLRPRRPFFALETGKGPKAQAAATHSPFALSLSKDLKGAKILDLEALPQERIAIVWLSHPTDKRAQLGLVLCLIPAVPEALLVERAAGAPAPWRILSRSRVVAGDAFAPPDGSQAPADLAVREGLGGYFSRMQREREAEAFDARLHLAEKNLRDLLKQARSRIRVQATAAREAAQEADWQRYGELLKASLHEAPALQPGPKPFYRVRDYAAEADVEIPGDPKLGAREQVDKFFALAKRKTRRAQEALTRQADFEAAVRDWEAARPPVFPDWEGLARFETVARVTFEAAAAGRTKNSAPKAGWLGKRFESREGLAILVGKSRDENLELTFKYARGNDLWMHVRGRPGAHVVIPLSSGRSASLETLLDAAALTIYYSGGQNWGKTEVDYTFKKYVKRIRDSTEASYTNNKTLVVEPQPERLKRLLAQNGT